MYLQSTYTVEKNCAQIKPMTVLYVIILIAYRGNIDTRAVMPTYMRTYKWICVISFRLLYHIFQFERYQFSVIAIVVRSAKQ